ncbi:MAG: uracil-xanthine permease family protein [Spirochaetes bacterium]|nr:uracil-xanthine permease family protein [Spirochaetota bacterium]MBU0955857.1 uracil-xanthine permease family protein [Spirochaetota bacterium]
MADSLNEPISGKTVVLGLQHTFVMFGATVLVPLLTGLDVGVTLFAAGVGTWIFHIVTKFKVPVFLGSSFAFLPALFVIGQGTGPGMGMPYALGGIFVAGLLYVVVSIIFTFVKADVLHKILPPHVTGPVIILIGVILAPVAILNSVDGYVGAVSAKIGIIGCWVIAIFTFAVAIFVKIGFKKLKWDFLSLLPVLIAIIAGYILAVIMGVVDFSGVAKAAWFGLPNFTLPKFSLTAISFTVPIAIVTMVEHFGDILAIGNVTKRDFIKDPGINRTLLGDGLATSLSAFIGGPANTTYSENTGAVALTGVYNPWVMRIAAIFAILLAMIPKFSALILTVPAPVIGGISILLFGMISSIGVKNMVDARVNLDDPKKLMIVAAMLVLGLGTGSVAQLAQFIPAESAALTAQAIKLGPFSLGGLGLAAIVGIILNLILRPKADKVE